MPRQEVDLKSLKYNGFSKKLGRTFLCGPKNSDVTLQIPDAPECYFYLTMRSALRAPAEMSNNMRFFLCNY